jgi:hypothetical protein
MGKREVEMFSIFTASGVFLVLALGAGLAVMARKWSEVRRQLDVCARDFESAQMDLLSAQQHYLALQGSSRAAYEPRIEALEAQNQDLSAQLQNARGEAGSVRGEDEKKAIWLDHQQQEIDWLRAELEKRPTVTRKTYKVLTLGMKWTGKTSLTLKWANPLVDLGKMEGTKIERYERTVSQVIGKDVTTEHVFEIGDWGGEHIVDAQQELIVDEIHGMLLVVDLGGKDARAVDAARIQEQLREFQAESLKYFFGPKTVASCKAVVLFINKSDLLAGTPGDVEEQAKALYAPLIDNLMLHKEQVDIRVFVGSANYGHSTHLLFSHFVEKILPRNAYDNQLLQRMKLDGAAPRPPAGKLPPPAAPAAPVPPPLPGKR